MRGRRPTYIVFEKGERGCLRSSCRSGRTPPSRSQKPIRALLPFSGLISVASIESGIVSFGKVWPDARARQSIHHPNVWMCCDSEAEDTGCRRIRGCYGQLRVPLASAKHPCICMLARSKEHFASADSSSAGVREVQRYRLRVTDVRDRDVQGRMHLCIYV
ncbi:hypothetical protein K466DRAFT_113010 [Polyporus arcularius HHB13444]|uniref:Uncharacterized protein n=1 Tax=Polyporus arcularius HHB13444 TaxID=1314778 RepID=A0A5C3PEF1_9APHY|nr:hypothetical protein K466DRAFT_113010 [Polyporus arcularius HHB13444]